MRNVLTKAAVDIPATTVDVEQIILAAFEGIDNLYSYIVYAKFKKGILDYWRVEFMLSQNEDYNQLPVQDVAKDIANMTELSLVNETQKVIGYKQPSIDVLITAYEPLIRKLVEQEHNRWNYLLVEDLMQMCRLTFMRLYRNGYYIHKSLLRRAFTNDVLLHIRKDKDKPHIVSIDSTTYSDEEDEISFIDTICDSNNIVDEQDILEHITKAEEFSKYRKMIIDRIGQRQYDQLLREYKNNMTTAWAQSTVYKLKKFFMKQGVN
jgi:hypothetical protein